MTALDINKENWRPTGHVSGRMVQPADRLRKRNPIHKVHYTKYSDDLFIALASVAFSCVRDFPAEVQSQWVSSFSNNLMLSVMPTPPKTFGARGIMFSGVFTRECVCASRKHMNTRYQKINEGTFMQYILVTCVFGFIYVLIRFWGQKVKGQDHSRRTWLKQYLLRRCSWRAGINERKQRQQGIHRHRTPPR